MCVPHYYRNIIPMDALLYVPFQAPLLEGGMSVFLIGGAEKAAELDAKRAIDQGTRLAAVIEKAKSGDVYNAPEGLKAKVCMRKEVGWLSVLRCARSYVHEEK